jgi:regulatory protein
MPRLTRITEHPRQPLQRRLEVDGEAFGAVDATVLTALGVREGAELDEAQLARLREAADEQALHDRALRLLTARARSTVELRRKLLGPGIDAAKVDALLERLARVGLLDDAAYARQVARSKALGTGASRRRVQQELARRGVARQVTAEAIDEVFEDEGVDERDQALTAARKRARVLESLPPEVRRRRLYAFLARRGYDPDTIRRALAVVTAATPDDDA